MVQKLLKGEDFWKFPDCSPKKGFAKILMTPQISAGWAESIDVLQVRIGWTDEKLFNSMLWLEIAFVGIFPQKVTPRLKFLSLRWNLRCLSRGCVDWANLSENRLNGWKVINDFFKAGNSYSRPKFGFFLGKMNPLEVFGKVGTPKTHFLARDRVFWRTDRQNRPSRFCWARWQETNKIN
jgi:hypothetical protein